MARSVTIAEIDSELREFLLVCVCVLRDALEAHRLGLYLRARPCLSTCLSRSVSLSFRPSPVHKLPGCL